MRKTYTIPKGSKYYNISIVGFIVFAILFLILWGKTGYKGPTESDAEEVRSHVETLLSGEPEDWYTLLHSTAPDRIKYLDEYRRILKRDGCLPSGEVEEVSITDFYYTGTGRDDFITKKFIEADVRIGGVMYHVSECYIIADPSGTGIATFSIEPKEEDTTDLCKRHGIEMHV